MERQMYTLTRLMTAEEYRHWLETSLAEDWKRDGVLSWMQLCNAAGFGVDLQGLLGRQVLIRHEWAAAYKLPNDPAFVAAHEEAERMQRNRREWTMQEWQESARRIKERVPEHLRQLVFAEKVLTSDLRL